jgi:hypothetical protein
MPVRFIRSTTEAADAQVKLGRTLGLTGGELQRLKHFADRTGTSVQDLGRAQQRATLSAAKAREGAKTEAAAFKALGLSIEEVLALPQDKAFALIADRLSKVSDRATQTQLAYDLLGRRSLNLLGVINQGGDALQQAIRDFDSFNLALTNVQSAGVEALSDTFGDLATVVSLAKSKIVAEMSPALVTLIEQLILTDAKTGKLGDTLNDTSHTYIAITATALDFAEGVRRGFRYISLFNDALKKLQTFRLTGVLEDIQAMKDTFSEPNPGDAFVERAVANLEKFRAAAEKPIAPVGGDALDPAVLDRGTASLEKQIAALEKRAVLAAAKQFQPQEFPNLQLQFELQEFIDAGATEAQIERIRAALETLKSVRMFEDAERDIDRLNALYEKHTGIIKGLTAEQIRYNSTIADLEELRTAGLLAQEEFIDAERRLQEELDESLQKQSNYYKMIEEFGRQAARNIQSAFADFLFDPFKDGIAGMADNFALILRRMAAEAAAAQILNSMFSGGGGLGGILGGFLGGGLASGGTMMPGKLYAVGEQGPELAMSRSAMHVFNADETRELAGGGRATQIFNIQTPDADSFRASQRQIARRARQGLSK